MSMNDNDNDKICKCQNTIESNTKLLILVTIKYFSLSLSFHYIRSDSQILVELIDMCVTFPIVSLI